MAAFKAFRPGVEVYGAVVLSVVDGMGDFRTMVERILAQHGSAGRSRMRGTRSRRGSTRSNDLREDRPAHAVRHRPEWQD